MGTWMSVGLCPVQPNSNLEVQVARLVINAVENVQDLDVS
jgi:hypothetical protein